MKEFLLLSIALVGLLVVFFGALRVKAAFDVVTLQNKFLMEENKKLTSQVSYMRELYAFK